jgi:hypothetical protein
MSLRIGETDFKMEIDLTKFPVDGEEGSFYQVYMRFYMQTPEDYQKIQKIGCALHFKIFEEVFGTKFKYDSSASFNTTVFFENGNLVSARRESKLI